MTNFTQEQLEAAKAAKSPEELIEMAKEAGVELTREQAEGFLKTSSGELSEEEMANVTGGGTIEESLLEQFNKWKKAAAEQGYESRHKLPCYFCGAGTKNYSSVYYLSFFWSVNGCGVCVDNKCFACGHETKNLDWDTGYPY